MLFLVWHWQTHLKVRHNLMLRVHKRTPKVAIREPSTPCKVKAHWGRECSEREGGKRWPRHLLSLLSNFPSLTQACTSIKHTLSHHTELSVSSRTRRLAPEYLWIAWEESSHMLELGIIWPSSSNWSSPLHIVPKHTPGGCMEIMFMWRLPCSKEVDHPWLLPCPSLLRPHYKTLPSSLTLIFSRILYSKSWLLEVQSAVAD